MAPHYFFKRISQKVARKDSLRNERQNSFNAKRLKHNHILTTVIAEK
jgi:hypothetical protein